MPGDLRQQGGVSSGVYITRPAGAANSLSTREGLVIINVAHLCIGARDLKESEEFYCGKLGMTKRFRFMKDGKECGFYVDAGGGSFIEVFAESAPSPPVKGPMRHICLQVGSITKASAQLRARGVNVSDKMLGADHSWQAWIEDPNGVKIELHEYTPDSCQYSGADCVLD
jgi:catechol 2,3-dioxygenase-like lactoylglutathione lyase family enzyme